MININDIKQNVNKLTSSIASFNIDSIFVEQNNNIDKLIYKDEDLHELRSCCKLLTAMAVGIAIDRNMFDLETKVYPIIKDLVVVKNNSNLDKIKKWTIKNLLTHTTGYESQMMSERFIEDIDKDKLLEYALNYDIPYEVGDRFAYNNVEPFIISVFFQEKFKINLCDFINENIFKKLNINKFVWDNYGKYCPGCTQLYLKHTDFHKIGQLLLHNGKYDNTQVVPEYWIKEMCKMQLETLQIYKPERVLPKIGVGYYTFISKDGFVLRDGSNGQYIIVNKSKNILITIMSFEKDMKNITEILRDII